MSTADSNNIGIKLQSAGENLNTWGDPNLNNDLIVLSNLASKFNSETINGDTTVSETNYSTSNTSEVATIKLVAGTVAAAFNFTMVGRPKRVLVWNAAGYTATIKLSATSGFELPNNRYALVVTDGSTDVYNLTPNYGGVASPTNSLDIPSWGAVQTSIATAGLPATSGTVLVSGTDTTAGYLGQKIAVAGNLALTTQNSGANEAALITHTPYWSTPRALASADSPITAVSGDVLLLDTDGAITVNMPASGRVRIVDVAGTAASNNITVTPAGGDTVTFGTIDTNYFSGDYYYNSTNWDLA